MKHAVRAGLAGLVLLGGLAAARAETLTFASPLTGASEVPPNTSPGKGEIKAQYDTATKTLTWLGTYAGLTGPVTAAHFHGPAEPGKNAGVMVPAPAGESPFSGKATLTDAQAAELTGGRVYFNLHTAAHPGGELRGQMVKAP
ncbi:CHRD domain-containing protein [uncultured Methylobacterium sp.]|uniref:CHRD domain-containing protein n=1 Tax=uncultured Methylobacterium sp. TaxID=157278 RepID=UPI002625D3A6|nr:CHRD domain-containing protein [uncultured Methylobacterium sp.]